MEIKGLSDLIGIEEDSYGNLKRVHYILSQIKRYGLLNKRILEIGCGSGDHICIPLAICRLSVLGIDINEESIIYANELKLSKGLDNAEFINIDSSELKSGSYDVIICSEVLEHLWQPQEMVKEIRRILCDRGIAIITVPNGFGPSAIAESISKRYSGNLKPWLKAKNIHKKISYFGKKLSFIKGHSNRIPGGSLNKNCPHIQNFSFNSLRKLLSEERLVITNAIGRTVLKGWLMTPLIERLKTLTILNSVLATYLPLFMCSGWLITVRKYETRYHKE